MSQQLREDVYWNKTDCKINELFRYSKPVLSKKELIIFHNQCGITDINTISNNINRFLFENDNKPFESTLQGSVYKAIDLLTGRRVIIKAANKNLVHSNCKKNGQFINEDIRKEAMILHHISDGHGNGKVNSDSGFCKFIAFLENEQDYLLVTDNGGSELFYYMQRWHPSNVENDKRVSLSYWKQHIQYHFRIIARCVYYFHEICNIAHMDLSLENCVIDNDIIRIIDFGLAKYDNNKLKKKWKQYDFVGKILYQSPEMRKLEKYFGLQALKTSQNHNNNSNINSNNNNNNNNNNTASSPTESVASTKTMDTSLTSDSCSSDVSNSIKVSTSPAYNNNSDDNTCPYAYNPYAADIWALGVMLFIMLVGAQPWQFAELSEPTFNVIINDPKSGIEKVLMAWDSTQYVDKDALSLLKSIFRYESNRIDIKGILNHKYVKNAPRLRLNK